MEVIVDRIEGEYVVVEMPDGQMVNLAKKLVPKAKEGDIISIKIDNPKTEKRKQHIKELMADVFK